MNSAIIINLDYDQHSNADCRRIWHEIEQRMLLAGFVKNNRLFLTSQNCDAACQQAKSVVAEIDDLLAAEGVDVFGAIREFYGLEYRQINDLLSPSNAPIEVDLVDTGTFRAYLAQS